ncbi:MAG: hypothetical protein ABIB47_04485 [Candidatus Woesearchaeota archaeon]
MVLLSFFNFLHFVGLAWGLGGATIVTVISIKSEKDKDIDVASMKLLPAISKFIWFGLMLLIISGVALPFYVNWPLDTQMLILKHIAVAFIVIIGVAIGLKFKKLHQLTKLEGKPEPRFLKAKKQIKLLSIINLILWYVVTLLSVFV